MKISTIVRKGTKRASMQICQNALSLAQERELMRRKRFQNGSVRPRKHGRRKVWVAQWWEQGGKRSKVLGHYAEITKGQATRSTSEPDILRYLIPAFGSQLVSAISRNDMQQFLEAKAGGLSESVAGHLRWHLAAIFKMAASDGVVGFNPAQALFIPACKAAPVKRSLSKDEVRTALSVLDVRERLVFRMAVFDGMRLGEIFAIQFGKIAESSVVIDKRLYGSTNIDTPKGRKGKNTTRTIGLAPGTIVDLNLWKSLIGDQPETAYVFSSETGVIPLRPNNHWKRSIRPRLEQIGLGWVNFQVLNGLRQENGVRREVEVPASC